jgi:LysR family hydrogen peroxide-inducible transcriptional activator
MNFNQLQYILAVDQWKSFARAADACHVTQATLSGMIKKLEEELNMVLFDRSRHPVQTTEMGIKVLEYARNILSLQSQMLSLSEASDFHPSGSLRLGIIPTVANSLLPLILPQLLPNYPELLLKITEITTEEILHQLKQDKLDAGILATPLQEDSFEEHILYYEPMMVYGVQSDFKKYLPSSILQNQNIWLLEEGNCFRNQSATICNIQEKNLSHENLQFAGSSFDTLLNLTDRFGGYTLVPELYYRQMPEAKKKKTRFFETPFPVREISLVFHRPYTHERTLKLLAEKIIQWVQPQLSTYQMSARDMEIIGIQ